MRIKKFIAIISLLSMTGLNSYAYDIVAENEDGVPIYYNYINDYKELEVTYKEINYASYIGEVSIPSDVTYSGRTRKVTSIGNDAFKYCKGLISITIPNSVTIIGELAFYECRNLEKVVVKDITAWCNIQFGHNPLFYAHHLYSDENTEITDLVIPNSVTSIGDGAFSHCSGLTSVTIPNSVTSIGESSFAGCTGLTSVTIGNSVTSIGNSAFENCRGLISVTIPNSVTNIGNAAFSWCMGLTSISIPNSVTSIGEMAFLRCTDLTSVTIGNSVTSIGASAFSNCTGLKKVIVKDIAAWCDIIFEENDSGQTLPNTNPLYYAHHLYCDENTEITDLVIPNGVRAIGLYAFYNCSGLTSVTIPNSVTSIGESSFYDCI